MHLLYLRTHGRFLNLRNPRTFDEKLQWYKLYYRDPRMKTLSDKYEVRQYLCGNGHAGILNELYGVYDDSDAIDFETLPERFVIKATHGSNMNIFCRDKAQLNRLQARAEMRRWLKTDFFYSGRQWCYQGIKPRLIAEKYLENEEFGELLDYKFYCYRGKPEVLFVCSGRYSPEGVKYNAYDMDWNRIYTYKGRPCSDLEIAKPANFEDLKRVAADLCGNFPFIRVDLYNIEERIVFGELTFYPDSGTVPFTPASFNYFFGDLFVLPPGAVAK